MGSSPPHEGAGFATDCARKRAGSRRLWEPWFKAGPRRVQGGPRADPGRTRSVGAAYVSVAAELAEVARGKPEGQEALRLGYLVAAARRGAGGTQGIHDELIRRIEQETNGVDTGSAAYRRGYRAGRDHG